MATIQLDHKAANVCAYCRVRKQRCDRSLPRCQRCAAKGRECDYSPVIDTRNPEPEPLFVEQGDCGSDLSYRGKEELLHAVDEWMSGVPGSWNRLLELVHEVLDLAEVSVAEIVDEFTWGIQRWLPVVDPDQILAGVQLPPVLLLSIFLITRKPCGHGEHAKRGTLYETVKQMLVLLQGLNDTYIEFVQAGIILAMYEVGHGMARRAHLTLGTCITMLNLEGPHLLSGNWELYNTPLRIRVAALVLDRIIPICTPTVNIPLLCPTTHPITKSVSLALSASSPIPPLSHDPVKKPSRKLQIQAQVALGTGRALQYIYALQHDDPDHETYEEVERHATEVVQLMVGKQEGHSWFMCDAVAMSFSALILLHQSRITHPPTPDLDLERTDLRTQLALKYSRRMAWDMCSVAMTKVAREPKIESLPFAGLACVWRAAVVVAETSSMGGFGERGGVFREVDLDDEEVEEMGGREVGVGDVTGIIPVLRRFEGRWGVGEVFRKGIEDVLMRDVFMDVDL